MLCRVQTLHVTQVTGHENSSSEWYKISTCLRMAFCVLHFAGAAGPLERVVAAVAAFINIERVLSFFKDVENGCEWLLH